MGFKGVVPAADYTFNASAKTVTFSANYSTLALSDILYILNTKSGTATVVYDPTVAAKGGTYQGRTLTLAHDTTSMSNSDPLQIIVAEGDVGSQINDLAVAIRMMLFSIANPSWVLGNVAQVGGSLSTVTTVATVGTVSNSSLFGNLPVDVVYISPVVNEVFQTSIRNRIT